MENLTLILYLTKWILFYNKTKRTSHTRQVPWQHCRKYLVLSRIASTRSREHNISNFKAILEESEMNTEIMTEPENDARWKQKWSGEWLKCWQRPRLKYRVTAMCHCSPHLGEMSSCHDPILESIGSISVFWYVDPNTENVKVPGEELTDGFKERRSLD